MDKEQTFKNNIKTVDAYEEKLKLSSWAQATIDSKLWKIAPFLRSFSDKSIKDITRKDVNKYLLELKKQVDEKKLKVSTYNKNLAEIRMFINWLVVEDDYTFLKERDLLRDLKFIEEKEDSSEKHYIDASDVKAMLPYCKCQRDRALIMLLWNTGARIGELVNTDVGDVNIKAREIKVTGKTGTRELPITTALPDLKLWLNQRSGKPDEPLFTSKNGISRLTIHGAGQVVDKLAKAANISEKKFSCHAYRHGRMTELAGKGMPEMHMRLHAGWTKHSLMPETYIHPKTKEVKNRVREIDTGKKVEETAPLVDMNAKICYNCNTENAFDAKYCSICSVVLDEHLALQLKEEEKQAEAEKLAKIKEELSIASVSSYEELNKQMQEMHNRMQEMYKRMPFEGLDADTQKRIKGLAILDKEKEKTE